MRYQASEKDEVTVTRRDVFVGLSASVVAVRISIAALFLVSETLANS